MLTLDANVWVSAFDPRDHFHDRSVGFLRAVATAGLRLHGPAFLVVEVSCALSRRSGDPALGAAAAARLETHPALTLHAMDERMLRTAGEVGVRHLLRAADALYAATAMLAEAPLVAWDAELVSRAGGVTPDSWLETRG